MTLSVDLRTCDDLDTVRSICREHAVKVSYAYNNLYILIIHSEDSDIKDALRGCMIEYYQSSAYKPARVSVPLSEVRHMLNRMDRYRNKHGDDILSIDCDRLVTLVHQYKKVIPRTRYQFTQHDVDELEYVISAWYDLDILEFKKPDVWWRILVHAAIPGNTFSTVVSHIEVSTTYTVRC